MAIKNNRGKVYIVVMHRITRVSLGVLLLAATLSIFSCGYGPPSTRRATSDAPIIRVGITQEQSQVDFAVIDKFRVLDASGRTLGGSDPQSLWRITVRNGRPKQMVYSLVVETFKNRENAEKLLSELRAQGLRFELEILGKATEFGGVIYADYRSYRVRVPGTFRTREAASSVQSRLGNRVWTTIVSEPSDEPNGTIEMRNLQSGKRFAARSLLQLVGSRVALKDVTSGVGYHYESSENRIYRGAMEFLVDNTGSLTVINIISLEEYLRGVVPFEMAGSFPLESLKAQAVAARTRVLSTMGSRHAGDPFDVCDDTHCQVYGGTGNETENSNLAVAETEGLVVTYKNKLCDTVYSGMCGGHTENAENVWPGNPTPYLRGVLDIHHGREYTGQFDLSDEANVRRWLNTTPNVFCNTVTKEAPPALSYTAKNFRWQLSRSGEQIRRTVQTVTGRNPGTVLDVLPLKRGISGRLIEVEVRGTQQSVIIAKELQIRRALADPPLFSACIAIDRKRISSGNFEFTFTGAGSGHGVGMCQTGAAIMAAQGRTFQEILMHYYTDVAITQLY